MAIKANKSELSWTEIDPAELPVEAQVAYAEYKAAYKVMKERREAFEAAGRAAIPAPQGTEVKFGYNFGKLSVALGTAKAEVKAKPGMGLAAFLAQQQQSGFRA